MKNTSIRFISLGLVFSIFWASASVAAKFGLQAVQPLVLYVFRFWLAAILMLLWAYLIKQNPWPSFQEFRYLLIFGFLNVSLALGFFIMGIREVAAGIGAMQVAINPLLIGVMSAVWMGTQIRKKDIIALFLGVLGIGIAAYPLLLQSYATPKGLVFLGLGMLAYSSSAIYFSSVSWSSSRIAINAWQAFFGGLFLLPFAIWMYDADANQYNTKFVLSVFWLAIPVSILAVSLWLYLLSIDTLRASYFLFLCPIFGFIYAYFILDEPFTSYTFSGLIVVLLALYIGQKKSR